MRPIHASITGNSTCICALITVLDDHIDEACFELHEAPRVLRLLCWGDRATRNGNNTAREVPLQLRRRRSAAVQSMCRLLMKYSRGIRLQCGIRALQRTHVVVQRGVDALCGDRRHPLGNTAHQLRPQLVCGECVLSVPSVRGNVRLHSAARHNRAALRVGRCGTSVDNGVRR